MSAQAEASAEAALNDEAATVADDDADHDSDSSDSVLTTAEREEREAAATRRRDEWLAQPKLMVGRKDPALFPAPAPAPEDDADSGGTYDYAASEFGIGSQFNPTKLFIDGAAALGLVWNRKRATSAWERSKVKRDAGGVEKTAVQRRAAQKRGAAAEKEE